MSKKLLEKPPIERVQADAERGLSSDQVKERVSKGYVNIADDPNEKSVLKILAGNLFTFFNIVLFIIAGVFIAFIIYLNAIGRSDIVNSYFGFTKFIFLIPAVMNVCMGTFQEIKSLKVIKKLRIVTGTKSKVVRDGKLEAVESDSIVLDDVIALTAGEQATADMTVLTGEVDVDESMLTGESDYIKKRPGDQILSGSAVIVGSARCRADKVGNDTYAAELTRKVKSGSRHKSELMGSIMKIIKFLTVGLSIAAIVVVVTLSVKISATGSNTSIWNGMSLSLDDPVTWSLITLTAGTFGIGMIPTGLVLTTSVALMVSIADLTKKQTLVQELYSLENLSRVDIICLDKTGTLTDGTMAVFDVKSYIPMKETERHARMLVSTSEDRNATSQAIYDRFGGEDDPKFKEIIPFSSANKYSGLVYEDGRKLLMGAPEYLLDKGDSRLGYVTEQANRGNRVIAMTLDGELIAFIAIEDHIRDTAPDTLKFFRENGVTVKVISGDNPLTVSKIAEKCGIVNADKYISLAGVPLEDIPGIASEYTVFARVSPEQKEALVTALQAEGHKVAMTGDGVNDILALRRSDSSITFAKATEAAKSCADVVLLDNDFSHLKEVVGEGRRVIGNTQKTAILYLMKSTATFILSFALIPLAKAQMWFSVENMYMLEAAVIGTGGFMLSLEPRRTPLKGSFLKNIATKAATAGILAAFAVLLPILLNSIPKALEYTPFVADDNVRAMMTILMSISGIVVVFSMCIPFNKYRALSLAAILAVAITLGLLLPTAYIGGRPLGAEMLSFDKAAGETVFDMQLVKEMFHPTRSAAVQTLISDVNNYIVLRLFLYVAIPTYILVYFAVENFARKEFKDVKKNRAFRIGRRLMLSNGLVLILMSLLTIVEAFVMSKGSMDTASGTVAYVIYAALSVIFSAIYFAIGAIGYKVWKDPTRKMIKVGFVAGMVLLVLTALPMIITGSIIESTDPRIMFDNIITTIIAVGFVVGAIIVRANIRLGLDKPRDKR